VAESFSLPLYPELSDDALDAVVEVLTAFVEQHTPSRSVR